MVACAPDSYLDDAGDEHATLLLPSGDAMEARVVEDDEDEHGDEDEDEDEDAGSSRYSFDEYMRDHVRGNDRDGFLVEGDMLMDSEERVRSHFVHHVAPMFSPRRVRDIRDAHDMDSSTDPFDPMHLSQNPNRLPAIVHEVNGLDTAFGAHRKLTLTYCFGYIQNTLDVAPVDEAEFKTMIAEVMNDIERAADVNFIHLAQYDDHSGAGLGSHGTCNPAIHDDLYFRIVSGSHFDYEGFNPANTPGAVTFIGTEMTMPGHQRALMFGNLSKSEIKPVTYHELGHILGLRHEHIRVSDSNPLCSETDDWQALTPHDPDSMMGYDYCDGSSGSNDKMTEYDRLGLWYLYNIPESPYGNRYQPHVPSVWPHNTDIFWYRPGHQEWEVWHSGSSGAVINFWPIPGTGFMPPKGKPFNIGRKIGTRPQDIFIYDPLRSVYAVNDDQGTDFDFVQFPWENGGRLVPIVARLHEQVFGHTGEDIFWHLPLVPQGQRWHPGNQATNFVVGSHPSVPTATRPILGHFYDGTDWEYWDILWFDVAGSSSALWASTSAGGSDHSFDTTIATNHCRLQAGRHYIPITGHFSSGPYSPNQVAWYAPYANNHRLVVWEDGIPCSQGGTKRYNAPYGAKPIVGDFNFDGYADIFFYMQGPGATDPNQVWLFGPSFNNPEIVNVQGVSGDYAPFARDFNGDGCTDILWFAPHQATSPVWRAHCDLSQTPGFYGFFEDGQVTHPPDAYPVGYGLLNARPVHFGW
jgi:hypothetical protein